jgi:NAD(P)-dependent dehydrogenase (short-subunit alcohol dehydrogenase family)
LEVIIMSDSGRTAIVTGASQGIGAGLVKAFLERGYNVVANSRKMTQSIEVEAGDFVALVPFPVEQLRIHDIAHAAFRC